MNTLVPFNLSVYAIPQLQRGFTGKLWGRERWLYGRQRLGGGGANLNDAMVCIRFGAVLQHLRLHSMNTERFAV